jgi:hypothetical protein
MSLSFGTEATDTGMTAWIKRVKVSFPSIGLQKKKKKKNLPYYVFSPPALGFMNFS